MKAQFKYAFRAGMHIRLPVFAVVFIMDLVFIIFNSLGLLPYGLQVTAVSLGGTAIAVMLAFNIVSDVTIARRMFTPPGAYLHALTPAPRRKILLASVITMMVLDIVTTALAIAGEPLFSMSFAGVGLDSVSLRGLGSASASVWLYGLLLFALLLAGYLLIVMIILFCVSVRKSLLYNKPAGGLLTAVLALVIVYLVSLSELLLAPFGTVTRLGVFFTVSIGTLGTGFYVLLVLIEAAVLYIFTSKLLERKVNI